MPAPPSATPKPTPGSTCRPAPATSWSAAVLNRRSRSTRLQRERRSWRTSHPAGPGTIGTATGIGFRVRISPRSSPPGRPWVFSKCMPSYLGGGPALKQLDTLRREWPISLHGVGAFPCSGFEAWMAATSTRLAALAERIEPVLISEHLAWSVSGGTRYLNDLLPLPYTDESLAIVTANIERMQERLCRRGADRGSILPTCALPTLPSRRPSSWRRWRSVPAAPCCSTSTTST
ncbi:MAG: DUF692 family protein [Rhodospirillales bacterium]